MRTANNNTDSLSSALGVVERAMKAVRKKMRLAVANLAVVRRKSDKKENLSKQSQRKNQELILNL